MTMSEITGSVDRLPPHSIEAERGVIGCILTDPNTRLPEVIERLKGDAKAFYDLRHQSIYSVLVGMFEDREQIDLITVVTRLRDQQLFDQVGGFEYILKIQDVPSAANLSYYLDIVWENFLIRRAVQTCQSVINKVYSHEGDVDVILDEIDRDLTATTQLRATGKANSIPDLVTEAIGIIERKFQSDEPTGLTTGMRQFDMMTDGLHGGEMIVIAARPSLGKSSLMMNWVEHIAIESSNPQPVGVFSLEMSATSIIGRSIGSLGRINVRDPRSLSEADFVKMNNAQVLLRGAHKRLMICDTPGLSVLELRARARSMVQQHGIKAVFIDYLQLLHGTSKKAKENRQNEISEISQGLKALAMELNIPVVVLSQLNRELEKNKRKPRVSDLRESGSIEQDADLVALLSHDCDEDGEVLALSENSIQANLDIAKQRNGPIGDIKLEFFKQYTKFVGASPIYTQENQ